MSEETTNRMRTDCFAYSERKGIARCIGLKKLYCEEEDCKFYKKAREVKADERA